MAYSVGNSEVANYANTSSGKVTNVAADDGLGGAGVVTDVTDRVTLDFVVATNIQFLTIDVTSLAGYVAGITDVTITVNPNVYVYGTNPRQEYPFINSSIAPIDLNKLDASLQIIGGAAGDTVKLVNNGNILGYGGDGSGAYSWTNSCCFGSYASVTGPIKGNAALSFITPGISLSIENNGYIAGGGGGGGGVGGNLLNGIIPGGGGGAGGGISGVVGQVPSACVSGTTIRALPPNAGTTGTSSYINLGCCNLLTAYGGGGGGFVLPGTGGVYNEDDQGLGGGGGAGGGGASSSTNVHTYNNDGGSANNAATTYTTFGDAYQGGGGGGWGASGAAGYQNITLYQAGAAGGNSIVTNGNAYTLTGSGTLYGSVDTALRSVVYTFPTSVYTGTQFDLATIPGYTAGINVVLIVPTNIRLASNSNISPGLEIFNTGSNPSSVRLVVNGAILGSGGAGGSETTQGPGGDALRLPTGAVTYIIDNTNGYVAGGGGGGGRGFNQSTLGASTIVTYGGGGAGLNGSSGGVGSAAYNAGVASGVASGTNGTNVVVGLVTYSSGGSGGTILPGVSTNFGPLPASATPFPGLGGSAGGTGAFFTDSNPITPSNRGGGYKQSGGSQSGVVYALGGGGGGWGAPGGNGKRQGSTTSAQTGRVGGYGIKIVDIDTKLFIVNQTNIAGLIGT